MFKFLHDLLTKIVLIFGAYFSWHMDNYIVCTAGFRKPLVHLFLFLIYAVFTMRVKK